MLVAAKTFAIVQIYCIQMEAAKCQDHISITIKGVLNKSLHQIKNHHDSSWDREF